MNNLYKDIDFNLLESDKKYRKIIIDNIADFITDYPYDDEYIEEDLTKSKKDLKEHLFHAKPGKYVNTEDSNDYLVIGSNGRVVETNVGEIINDGFGIKINNTKYIIDDYKYGYIAVYSYNDSKVDTQFPFIFKWKDWLEENSTISDDKTDSMSEDLRTINIRDELNKLDTIDYNDLVNMYDCLKLSDLEKTQLAQLLANHDNENAIKFISDRYYKENICEDNDNTAEQDIEVSVSLGNRIKQIYDADAEQADIQYENKNYKAWDAFDKKWEPLHLLLVQYDRHNRRPLEKVIDRMRPEDQKQLIDRYLKENLQEQNFDSDMPE